MAKDSPGARMPAEDPVRSLRGDPVVAANLTGGGRSSIGSRFSFPSVSFFVLNHHADPNSVGSGQELTPYVEGAAAETTEPGPATVPTTTSVDIGSAKSCRARASGRAMTHDLRIGSGVGGEGSLPEGFGIAERGGVPGGSASFFSAHDVDPASARSGWATARRCPDSRSRSPHRRCSAPPCCLRRT